MKEPFLTKLVHVRFWFASNGIDIPNLILKVKKSQINEFFVPSNIHPYPPKTGDLVTIVGFNCRVIEG